MNKKSKYAINGAVLGGAANGLLNVILQMIEMSGNKNQNFDWGRLLNAFGKGVLVGGIAGLVVGAAADYKNSKVKPLNTDNHLTSFANNIRLSQNDPSYLALRQRASRIVEMIRNEYGSDVSAIRFIGSTEHGTALRHGFDIDISVNFTPSSFRSTEEMFYSVLNFFKTLSNEGAISRVRDQKKSVGVYVDLNGSQKRIDIVPCKLTEYGGGDGYLYVNDKSLFGSPSYTKTNFAALQQIKLTDTQKKLCIILKSWKAKYDLPLRSYLIQLIIVESYRSAQTIPRQFTKKVIMVMQYIVDHLDNSVIRGIENSNNILSAIPAQDKERIIDAAESMLSEFEYQNNSIVETLT
jgi:hypothetical protein